MVAAAPEFGTWFWPVAGMVAAIAVLAWGLARLSGWFHEGNGPAASTHEMLAEYREMRLQGDLTEEEFRSIMRRLAPKLSDSDDSPANPKRNSPLPAETTLQEQEDAAES